MVTPSQAERAFSDIRRALTDCRGAEARATAAVRRLSELPHFRWIGVYWLRGETLELGPYVGAPTEHTRIPVGRGVCGTAVAEGRNQVVRDVRELENYLACSLETRSEIVVLIRDAAGAILGQIDVDGHEAGAFDETDERLLERVAALITGGAE